MNTIKYEGISFNADWINTKSQTEFLKEAEENKHWFDGDPNRDKKLREVHALATGKKTQPTQTDSEVELQQTETPPLT